MPLSLCKKCKYEKDGLKCDAPSVGEGDFCSLHIPLALEKKVERVKIRAYSQEIWDALKDFKADNVLDSMDLELTYLKTLPGKLEEDPTLMDHEKVMRLVHILDKITQVVDRRSKHMSDMKYAIGYDVFDSILRQIFSILQKHVKDVKVLNAVGEDFAKLRIQNSPIANRK